MVADGETTSGSTPLEVADKLRHKGHKVRLIDMDDDGFVSAAYIFAVNPNGPTGSQSVWFEQTREAAEAWLPQLKKGNPDLGGWRVETFRIPYETYRMYKTGILG